MIQPTKEERKLEQSQEPPKYTVVILDDPYTSIEFVIELLQVVFKLSHEDSELIAYNIHSAGKQNVGEFSKEIAAYRSYCDGHSNGISMAMVYMWSAGEVFTLIYTIYLQEWVLSLNYGANLLVLCVIIYFKIFPNYAK